MVRTKGNNAGYALIVVLHVYSNNLQKEVDI